MYLVSFDLYESHFGISCADFERACALASLLKKIETEECKYGDLRVVPIKNS